MTKGIKKVLVVFIVLVGIIFSINLVSALWEGTIAYYTLDETSGIRYDSLGMHNGVATAGLSYGLGKIENAIQGSGSIDNVNLGAVLENLNSFSISWWQKSNNRQCDGTGACEVWIKTSPASFYLAEGGCSNTLLLRHRLYFNGQNCQEVPQNLNDNNWHHLVFIATNGGRQLLYVDNTLIVDASAGSWSNFNNDLYLFDYSYKIRLGDFIDEVGIWNRALSPSEVSELYSNGEGLAHDFDRDGDGFPENMDNCPGTYNPGQEDDDADGIGDVCDNCIYNYNPSQTDRDGDGIGNACIINEIINENLTVRVESLEAEVAELKTELENQKSLINTIQETLNNFINKIIGYLTHLNENNREDMLCGYLEETGETSIDDLGLHCEIIEGKKGRNCVCNAV